MTPEERGAKLIAVEAQPDGTYEVRLEGEGEPSLTPDVGRFVIRCGGPVSAYAIAATARSILATALRQAVAEEREACAVLAESLYDKSYWNDPSTGIAAVICAQRSNQTKPAG